MESVILTDEAVPPAVLLGFARATLNRGLSFVYRARARFTSDLTQDACKVLYDSGCRYLGLGLEAASARVNRLVNKHLGNPPDYQAIVDALESAGVRTHIYCIMGFPTETRSEIESTFAFISENIIQQPYLTVSANAFYLMKGSEIWREAERFGIREIHKGDNLALTAAFDEPQRNANESYIHECAQRLYQQVFLPHVSDIAAAEGYWHFVDQTGIFYLEKVHYSRNPYHDLANDCATSGTIDGLARLERSFVFEIKLPESPDSLALCDWVTLNYVHPPAFVSSFFGKINLTKTVAEWIAEECRGDTTQEEHLMEWVVRLVSVGMLRPAHPEWGNDQSSEVFSQLEGVQSM